MCLLDKITSILLYNAQKQYPFKIICTLKYRSLLLFLSLPSYTFWRSSFLFRFSLTNIY